MDQVRRKQTQWAGRWKISNIYRKYYFSRAAAMLASSATHGPHAMSRANSMEGYWLVDRHENIDIEAALFLHER